VPTPPRSLQGSVQKNYELALNSLQSASGLAQYSVPLARGRRTASSARWSQKCWNFRVFDFASNTTLAMSRPGGSAEELRMPGGTHVPRLNVPDPGEQPQMHHSACAIGSDRLAGQSCQPPALSRVSKGFLRKQLARVHEEAVRSNMLSPSQGLTIKAPDGCFEPADGLLQLPPARSTHCS
jgi:hypothetical protein